MSQLRRSGEKLSLFKTFIENVVKCDFQPKAPNLNTFIMVNIYDCSIKSRKQLIRGGKEKIIMEILNKGNEMCNDSELMFKENEYRTALLKSYKWFLRESKLNNDLEFDQINPSTTKPEIIKKNYKIIDAFH